MKKIIFNKVPKEVRKKESQQIRVKIDIYEKIVKITEETGLTMCQVTSKIFAAALPYVELIEPFNIEEEKDED